MVPTVTLLQLVDAVNEFAETEAELLAVVIDMVNRGKVELGGTFRGRRFVFESAVASAA